MIEVLSLIGLGILALMGIGAAWAIGIAIADERRERRAFREWLKRQEKP